MTERERSKKARRDNYLGMVGREGYNWSSLSVSSLRGAEGPSDSSSARCWTRLVRDCSTCRVGQINLESNFDLFQQPDLACKKTNARNSPGKKLSF